MIELIIILLIITLYFLNKPVKVIETKLEIPQLSVENVSNVYLLYETKTNTFMCQGNTLEELAEKLLENNKIDLAFVKHDKKHFVFASGKIKGEIQHV